MTEAVANEIRPPRSSDTRRIRFVVAVLLAGILAAGGVWAANELMVGRAVSSVLARDSRNSGVDLHAHFGSYVNSAELVLDLRRADGVSAADLLRVLFTTADTLFHAGRQFDRVSLSRSGTVVFVMTGADFTELGEAFGSGENPVFLMRTFPQRLARPDGSPAFDTWSGGLLGVVTKQMEDVSAAAREWVDGAR